MPSPDQPEWSIVYHASYTAKDLLQYALAVGFSSSNDDDDDDDNKNDELRYTFEGNPNFAAVPTFCFALPSWASASDGSFSHVQAFPTPLMTYMGVIPTTSLRDGADVDSCPVIHMSQSVIWHQKLPVPTIAKQERESRINTLVSGRTLSVTPKSIGTFVENETRVRLGNGDPLCTLSATLLVLGMESSKVIALGQKRKHPRRKMPNRPPDFEWSYQTTPNQALLYRLASGDFNSIHVDSSSTSAMMGDSPSNKPILHGLCTLGIAMRGLLLMMNDRYYEIAPVSLHAQFTKPVFVGDALTVQAWSPDDRNNAEGVILFRVVQEASSTVVLDGGEFTVQRKIRIPKSKL